MKKLVILASAIAMAFMTQAAQFNWQFTANKSAATAYDGADVYMVLASDWTTATVTSASDISDLAKSSGKLTVGSMTASTGTINVHDSWVTEGSTYSWYAIVVKDDQYYVSSSATSSTAVADTATPANVTFASKSEMATASNWKQFSDVPEPTSAMLMLLGVAGLALKRKRA